MRKMATVEVISDVRPIDGADMIVAATVRGWTVVVKKGEFVPGDGCVYFEIDSLMPTSDSRYEFLATRGEKTLEDGSKGHVLRTAKLRGVFSQGLALPIGLFPEIPADTPVGTDVSDILGIVKYEPPIPADLAGTIAGAFPSWLAKTDEERVQNLGDALPVFFPDGVYTADWQAYEKLDGTSTTVFLDPATGQRGVASRNWSVTENPDNAMWAAAFTLGLHDLLEESGLAAVQGELFGPGIQGNPLKLQTVEFRVFDVWGYNAERLAVRLPSADYPQWVDDMRVPRREDVEEALLGVSVTPQVFIDTVDKMKSVLGGGRLAEGVVFRHTTAAEIGGLKASFKAISNTFLAKNGG